MSHRHVHSPAQRDNTSSHFGQPLHIAANFVANEIGKLPKIVRRIAEHQRGAHGFHRAMRGGVSVARIGIVPRDHALATMSIALFGTERR